MDQAAVYLDIETYVLIVVRSSRPSRTKIDTVERMLRHALKSPTNASIPATRRFPPSYEFPSAPHIVISSTNPFNFRPIARVNSCHFGYLTDSVSRGQTSVLLSWTSASFRDHGSYIH